MKKNNNILYKKQYRYKRKHSYQFLTKKTTEESLLINQKQEILTKNSKYNKDITKKQNKPIETQKTNNQSNNLNKKSFFSKLLFWRKTRNLILINFMKMCNIKNFAMVLS
ncbi:hypothetical protein NWE59_01275 [Mycoplasmopsis felis]|uniref:hypothetical protein n=1 Tax=Mycoplasmopsis felis TaxID=33923 RepID=UPI0021AF6ACC|nr:hypothetical protein [Mycoplasmopsis felis]UWV78736.1 hypothetical protein NWE59_01275 [Mycoplasmopsis felis]